MAASVEELINEIKSGIIDIDEIKRLYRKELIKDSDGTWSIPQENTDIFDAVLEQIAENRLVVPSKDPNPDDTEKTAEEKKKAKDAPVQEVSMTAYLGKDADMDRFERLNKATQAAEFLRSKITNRLAHCGSIEHFIEQNQIARDVRWALGISDKALHDKMEELLRSGKGFDNASRWDTIDSPEEQLTRKDKKLLKALKENQRDGFDTELYAAALRELTIEKSENACKNKETVQVRQRASLTDPFKKHSDLKQRELELRSMLLGDEILPGFGNLEATQSSTIESFINDLKELGRQEIPTTIYEQLELNQPAGRQSSAIENIDGRNDIMQLQTSTRENCSSERVQCFDRLIKNPKYKNIDFKAVTNKAATNSEKDCTLADTAFAFVGIYAKEHAKARIEEIVEEKKEEKRVNKKARNPEDLSEIYSKEEMGKNLETSLPEDKGKSRKSGKTISKCPYRALAGAMKMINQLARMMCMSFQKTIGAGGFYKGLTQDEYNKTMGFGQRFNERATNLTWFFFGGEFEASNVKKSISPSPAIGEIPGPANSTFRELCNVLKISPDEQSFKNFLGQNGNPDNNANSEKVEEAMEYMEGLSKDYSNWVSQNGIDAQQDAVVAQQRAQAQANAQANAQTGDEYSPLSPKMSDEQNQELKDVTDINIMFNDVEICRLSPGPSEAKKDIRYLKDMNEIYKALSSGDRDQILKDLALEGVEGVSDVLDGFLRAGGGGMMTETVNYLYQCKNLKNLNDKIAKSNASPEDKEAFSDGTLDAAGYKRLKKIGALTDEDTDLISIIGDPNFPRKGMPPNYKGGAQGIPLPAKTLPVPFEEKIKTIKRAFSTKDADGFEELVGAIGGGQVTPADIQNLRKKIIGGTLKDFDENAALTPEMVHAFAEIIQEIKKEAAQAVNTRGRTGGRTGGTTTATGI